MSEEKLESKTKDGSGDNDSNQESKNEDKKLEIKKKEETTEKKEKNVVKKSTKQKKKSKSKATKSGKSLKRKTTKTKLSRKKTKGKLKTKGSKITKKKGLKEKKSSKKNLKAKSKKKKKIQTTGAFEDKTRTTEVFPIILVHGKAKKKIMINPVLGVLASKIYTVFKWNKTQTTGIVVSALSDDKGNIKKFKENRKYAYEKIISANAKLGKTYFFNHDQEYTLITEDLRDDVVSKLTEEELDDIKQTFELFDKDHNGTIEIEEIKSHFNTIFKINKRKWQKFATEKTKEAPHLRRAFEIFKKESIARDKSIRDRNIKFYSEMDVNNDNSIDLQEFIAAESILRLEKSKSEKTKVFTKTLRTEVRANLKKIRKKAKKKLSKKPTKNSSTVSLPKIDSQKM